jgi:hypothetical protein
MTERLTDESIAALQYNCNVYKTDRDAALDELRALRARVAKLEGALNNVARFSVDLGSFARAALKDAPQ